MKNLLTLDYWFNLTPEAFVPLAQKSFITLVVALAAAALLIAIIKSRGGIYRGFFKRLYAFCLANAIIGLLFLFFNYEGVPFLSARFWLGLWVLMMIAWIIPVIISLKAIPQKKKEREQEENLKKYIPK
ncbi:MAG: hypothetical protein WC719_02380 [Patescibacteria group bacterium]|jgi:hypothetical protein